MRTTIVLTCLLMKTWCLCAEKKPLTPLEAVAPIYPMLAVYSDTSGAVTIKATINKVGAVISATTIEGHVFLKSSALDAAKKWRFEPGNEKRTVNLVFVFRIMPKETPAENLATRFQAPWQVEVRRVIPESPVNIDPAHDQTCAERSDAVRSYRPEGAECWTELANQPGCYIWNSSLATDATATWTGECSGGLAHGEGTRTFVYGRLRNRDVSTGILQDGKAHGRWVEPNDDRGYVWEGTYVDGKRHGRWVSRFADGAVLAGSYVDGKRHGRWVRHDADGTVLSEGSYVDGKKQGHWFERDADGNVAEGLLVDGQAHGRWVYRNADGRVTRELTWVNGEQQ